jgi:hypothetical protein
LLPPIHGYTEKRDLASLAHTDISGEPQNERRESDCQGDRDSIATASEGVKTRMPVLLKINSRFLTMSRMSLVTK